MSRGEETANVHQRTVRVSCHEAPKICVIHRHPWKTQRMLLCKLLSDFGSPREERLVEAIEHFQCWSVLLFNTILEYSFKRLNFFTTVTFWNQKNGCCRDVNQVSMELLIEYAWSEKAVFQINDLFFAALRSIFIILSMSCCSCYWSIWIQPDGQQEFYRENLWLRDELWYCRFYLCQILSQIIFC